jgi:hypothetical protein
MQKDRMYRPERDGAKKMPGGMTKPGRPLPTKPMRPMPAKPGKPMRPMPGMMNKPVYDKNAAKKEALRLMGGK